MASTDDRAPKKPTAGGALANPTWITSPVDFTKSLDAVKLKDKSVLITGGASGLGAGTAQAFAEVGAYVTIADLESQAAAADMLVKDLTSKDHHHIQFVPCDVLDWDSQVRTFKKAVDFSPAKRIDVVIPFAGVTGDGPIVRSDMSSTSPDEAPEKPGTRTLEVNLTGQYYTASLAQHYFRLESPTARSSSYKKVLILVSSMAGYSDLPGATTYGTSKWAIRGLFRTMRRPMGELGFRTNLLAPWFIKTPLTKVVDAYIEKALKGRYASMEVLVETCLRIAGDEEIDCALPVRTCGA